MDGKTKEKWDALNLGEYVIKQEGSSLIQLNEQKKCPFLNEDKLCKLVIEHGADILSKTCTTFPREYHEYEGRTESSLMMACPVVVDLIRDQDKITFNEELSQMKEGELFELRNVILHILRDEKYDLGKSLMMIFYLLLENEEKGEGAYKDTLALRELSDAIDHMEFSKHDSFDERNELFLDLAENYRKEKLYVSYLEPIAVIAEQLSDSYTKEELVDKRAVFETKMSDFEPLFRNYLVAEVFHNSLMPESDLEGMIVMMQWISMEYASIRHSIFLSWMAQGEEEVSYEMVRQAIVILSRMTGYEEGDIYEYLENSFESLIWEWGYLALILG
ncbi:fliB domain protein [Lachnospiraceae bacterium KM106-2]|nr:fliB domain protein [Lachnospiraceae bacterium KM106-2]